MRIFPSGCTATARTWPSAPAPGLKAVSGVPLVVSRAMKFQFVPLIEVKMPPTTILPSDCAKTAFTALFANAFVNPRSSEPSVSSRASRLRATPLTFVKRPPMTTLPSPCSETLRTAPLAPVPGLNEVSSEPSALTRATRLRDCPSTVVNSPPIRNRPLPWMAMEFTFVFGPGEVLNVESTVPAPASLSRMVSVAVDCAPSSAPVLATLNGIVPHPGGAPGFERARFSVRLPSTSWLSMMPRLVTATACPFANVTVAGKMFV